MNIPTLTTDLKMPKILWYQTDYHVHLRIQLIDVDKYYLRVDREKLQFRYLGNLFF